MCGQYGRRVMSERELNEKPSVDAQLATLQAEYIANLYERVLPVLSLWQDYIASNYSPELLRDVYRKVHAIAGTSSILNVKPIDRLSNQVQIKIQTVLQAADIETTLIAEIGLTLNEILDVAKSGDINAPPINLNT
jgi:hypothetical protein